MCVVLRGHGVVRQGVLLRYGILRSHSALRDHGVLGRQGFLRHRAIECAIWCVAGVTVREVVRRCL